MSRRLIAVLLLLVVLTSMGLMACQAQPAAPAPAPVVPAKTWLWRFQNIDLPGAVSFKVVEAMADRLSQGSDGRIQIEVYPGGALVPSMEILAAAGKGVVDMAWWPGSYQPGMVPEGPMGTMPLMTMTAEDYNNLYYELGWHDIMIDAYLPNNVYVFGHSLEGSINVWGTSQIRKLSDFEGKKVRFFGVFNDLVAKAGASSVFIPHEESVTALSLGTVDIYGTSLVKYRDMSHYEICKYVLATPFLGCGTGELFLNLDQWNDLPDSLKPLMELSGREFAMHGIRANRVGEREIFKKAESEWGVTLTELSPEDVVQLRVWSVKIWEETAAQSPRGPEMLRILKDYWGLE